MRALSKPFAIVHRAEVSARIAELNEISPTLLLFKELCDPSH
jgi:hypothetical protein